MPARDLCASVPRGRSTQQGVAPCPPAARVPFWSSSSSPLLALIPFPPSLQPQPAIGGAPVPARESRWLEGLQWGWGAGEGWRQNQFSKAELGSGWGPSPPPPQGWADSRGPARHRPGAGPPPPPPQVQSQLTCQGAVCSLPGVNVLLETIKLLRAQGAAQAAFNPQWSRRRWLAPHPDSREAEPYRGEGRSRRQGGVERALSLWARSGFCR